jgi:hypothetical protein
MLGNFSEAERLEDSQEGVSALLQVLSNAFKYCTTQVKLKVETLKR